MQVPPPGPEGPPSYTPYPRGQGTVAGTADQLASLRDGYFGLNRAGLITFVLVIGLNVVWATAPAESKLLYIGLGYPAVMVVSGLSSYPYNKKIAFGAGWNPGIAILASALSAMFSCICWGLLGLIVMQMVAAAQIKKFGVRSGAFGLKKDMINARIEELRAIA